MRLGAQDCQLREGTKAHAAYDRMTVSERHRHRYEFNNVYREQFRRHGMSFSGLKPDGSLVEIIEVDEHPWFVAVQFHPEFRSKPIQAHPLFAGFVEAAISRRRRDTRRDNPTPSPVA